MTKRTASKRPTNDTAEDRQRTYFHLKNAFGLIKSCSASGLYMPAYITAFSIIEDRLYAMYVVAKRVAKEPIEVRNFGTSILEYAKELVKRGVIDTQTHDQLKVECDLRNKRVHGAMWRLDEYTKENTETVVSLAKKLNGFRKAQSKVHGIGDGARSKAKSPKSK